MLDTAPSPSAHLRPEAGPQVRAGTGLERLRLAHRALPGRDLADVDLATPLLGALLAAPVVVSASAADARAVARAASEHGLGLVLGGGRGRPEDPIAHYRTPDRPPLLIAGIRLAELHGPDGPARGERLAAMLDADGLAVELDPVGEALDPGGDPRFAAAEATIAALAGRVAPLPVIVRATRCGMDAADVRALQAAGAAAVDVGGATFGDGAFAGWGVPTADAVAEAVLVEPGLPVLAGAGDGVQAAVCLALGATAAAPAWPLDAGTLVHQLRVAVWAAGAASAGALTPGHLRGP